jgi:excisionase family DNA binding protein
MNKIEKKMYSCAEVAQMLGISRIAVFNKIKNGQLTAHKVGRSYAIDSLDVLFGKNLPQKVKTGIETTVTRAVKEYGEAFRKLGKE